MESNGHESWSLRSGSRKQVLTEEQKARKREVGKRWRAANAEKLKQSKAAYYEKHKDECVSYQQQYRWSNRERLSEYRKDYNATHHVENAEYKKHWHRERKYGLTEAEFDVLLSAQGGKCSVCGVLFGDAKADRPHVDHCHTTGRVRGLLCHHCNTGLGHFRDSPETLQAAIQYLRNSME
jgi:hypothetical protein